MLAVVGALVFSSACHTSTTSQTPAAPVRIALTNTPLPYLPVILADSLGYYRQEGLAVTIDDFSSASKVMQALLGGSADVGAGAYEQAIQMAAEGRQVRSFVLMMRQPTRAIVVAPRATTKIRRIEDLKGTVIGVAGVGSINHVFLNYVLLKHGIAPAEVKPVAIGTAASAISAIEHDIVEAAVLSGNETAVVMRRSPGVAMLLDARGPSGCRNLYGVDVYPGTVLYSNDSWLRTHVNEARHVARAMQKTLAWISTHSPQEVFEATPRQYRTENRQAELEALRVAKLSFSPDGRMPTGGPEAVRKALAFTLDRVRNAHFDLSQTYTNEFLASR